MTRSVLLLTPVRGVAGDVIEPRRVRLRDRLTARLRAHGLDRRLADGVPPECSAALSLRAARLIEPGASAALGRRLEHIVAEADGRLLPRARVAARRRPVLEAADELAALARRLAAPDPRGVRGVAQARLLLTDGCGPMYSHRSGEDLTAAVRRARAALELI
ncbi:MAG TPA: hypothetical protein VHF51_10195 [Solirubrobacteraceae bacterium]|nr:hypothetical protein [Solirubrobacteraceae bacterium]